MSRRVQLWSCGGGRQSAGIAALIVQGRLPKPDHARMIRLEWEADTVWPYVDTYIRPAMERLGVPFTAIDRKEYATKDLWGGADGDTLLIPAFSDFTGDVSKFAEYCSGEWKRECGNRWAAAQPGWKQHYCFLTKSQSRTARGGSPAVEDRSRERGVAV